MKNTNTKAFTLVELIVVITILAILWTIAFISMQWYSKSSRDSVRISDMSSIKSWLELFYLEASKYPLTTDPFNISYSWTVIWTQWTFWNDTSLNVKRIQPIPLDPLTDKKYTYSVTKIRQEYQLAWISETGDIVFDDLLNNANAWNLESIALVTWNFNWMLVKVLIWNTCNILAIPSIVSNQAEWQTELVDIVTASWFVYNGFNNLSSDYINSKYNSAGWFNFTPNQLVAYTDNNWCSDLYWVETINLTARSTLISWLRNSYDNTILVSKANISALSLWDTNQIWALLVNNLLWWKIVLNDVPSWAIIWSWWLPICIFDDPEWNWKFWSWATLYCEFW